jgi:hypothetical protein
MRLKPILFIALVVGLAVLLWAFIAGRKEAGTEAQSKKPIKAPTLVSMQNGEVTVKMDSATQAKNGIQVAPLDLSTRQQELRGNAIVLPLQDLITLRNNYVSAKTQVDKANAALDVSGREYERLNGLYKDERNASAKSVQAAEGTMRSDEATQTAAEDGLLLMQNNIRQQWGDVIARSLFAHSPEFDRLVQQQDFLVQVMLPPGTQTAAPRSASLETAQGKLLNARLVSPFPRLDPRIQSPSFLYMTGNQPGLIPGLNLAVLLPSGPVLQGVTVPANAVVWWEGKAWAYVQLSPDQFSRREVPTELPVNEGWFAPITTQANPVFRPGEKLVVNGAQQLLSEESRSQIQTAGETD